MYDVMIDFRVAGGHARSLCLTASVLVMIAMGGAPVDAQLPTTQLGGVFPAGAASGSEVEVVISGANLDDAAKLLFSHDGITALQKHAEPTPFDEGPQSVENTFVVRVDEEVAPGRYEVRCSGKFGLSNPRVFIVGQNTEVIEVEPNGTSEFPNWTEQYGERRNEATSFNVPATLNGQSSGGADVDWFRFRGSGGEELLIDGFANRVDSQTEFSLKLFRSDGTLLAEGELASAGDRMIFARLPADGEYFLKVHDALYRNGPGFHYRIEVGSRPHIDFVFPPAGQPGTESTFAIYGVNLPGGKPSDLSIGGRVLERAEARIAIPADWNESTRISMPLGPHQGGLEALPYRVESDGQVSNPVLVTAASAPIVVEAPENDEPDTCQNLIPPCEVNGQFYPLRDRDWYSFQAKKDEVWAIDVMSERLGIPTDPSLLIQQVTHDETGKLKVTDVQFIDDVVDRNSRNHAGRHEFDTRTTDPSYLFTVPAGGTYRVLVQDALSSVKNDPRLVYRLAIRRPDPDYRIVAVPGGSSGSMLLRRGGRNVVRVFVFRRDGFDGEIRVRCDGLPHGVTSEEIIIGPENHMGTLVLTTDEKAPASVATLSVSSNSVVNGNEVIRRARYGAALEPFQFAQANAVVASVRSRIVDRIQLCVTDEHPSPMRLTIGDGNQLRTSRGGKLKIPYHIEKADEPSGNLTAVATDIPFQTSVGRLNIGSKESGEFEMRFQAATPPGTYSFYLAGFNQGYRYRRNPESYERAKDRQERVAKILAQAQQKVDATQRSLSRKNSELRGVNGNTKESQAKLEQLRAEVRQLEKDYQAARAFQQSAQREKQRADQEVNRKRNDANPRGINIAVPSNSLTVTVDEFPIRVEALEEERTVKQGEKISCQVKIARLYDFKNNVTVQVRPPRGVSGIGLANLTIPGSKPDGTFEIEVAPTATVGSHECTLRLQMVFNGQNFTMERTLLLHVIEGEAAK